MKLTRYEQETIINFNAGDQTATLYTRGPVVMRQLDALVTEYPDIFKCVGETDIDKTYSMTNCMQGSKLIPVAKDITCRRRKG